LSHVNLRKVELLMVYFDGECTWQPVESLCLHRTCDQHWTGAPTWSMSSTQIFIVESNSIWGKERFLLVELLKSLAINNCPCNCIDKNTQHRRSSPLRLRGYRRGFRQCSPITHLSYGQSSRYHNRRRPRCIRNRGQPL
jgi:hypothetical protein